MEPTKPDDTTSPERDHIAARRHGDIGGAAARRPPTNGAQTEAGGVAAPLAPSAASPSQSVQTEADATTRPVDLVAPSARRVARAILSTLTPDAAACVLCALAGLASAIINAASTLRHATGEGARLAASTMLEAASGDAFDALRVDGEDCGTAAYAVCASWWFSTPCDVVVSFWRDDIARANVEAQARGVLAEVDAMRREVSQSEPSAAVRAVEGLPFPAVRLADGTTLINPDAVRPLAREGEVLGAELPAGVDRIESPRGSWRSVAAVSEGASFDNVREHIERGGLETVLRSEASVAPRVLRVEAPPFASCTSKGLAASVGRVLYAAPSNVAGFTDTASGLAGIAAGSLDATDAANLVTGLAKIADHYAAAAAEAREAQDVRIYLRDAAEALDAAGLVARSAIDALDAVAADVVAYTVTVNAA